MAALKDYLRVAGIGIGLSLLVPFLIVALGYGLAIFVFVVLFTTSIFFPHKLREIDEGANEIIAKRKAKKREIAARVQ